MLAGGIFSLIAFTASHYGLTLDDPNYFVASDLEVHWFGEFFKGLVRGDLDSVLSDKKIESAWRWDPYHVPHPPFSRLLSGLTKAVLSPFMDKFTAYRVAPALFFTLLVTDMYLWMTALFDRATGLFSALALKEVGLKDLFLSPAYNDPPTRIKRIYQNQDARTIYRGPNRHLRILIINNGCLSSKIPP